MKLSRGRVKLHAFAGSRKDFPRIAEILRIQCCPDFEHHVKVIIGEYKRHCVDLFEPDPMFSAERAPNLNADFQDLLGNKKDILQILLVSLIEEDKGVEVSIPGMKDIGHSEVIFLREVSDFDKNFREF